MLLAALQEAQSVVRSYDTKAQIAMSATSSGLRVEPDVAQLP
jgi:hypothetical protein